MLAISLILWQLCELADKSTRGFQETFSQWETKSKTAAVKKQGLILNLGLQQQRTDRLKDFHVQLLAAFKSSWYWQKVSEQTQKWCHCWGRWMRFSWFIKYSQVSMSNWVLFILPASRWRCHTAFSSPWVAGDWPRCAHCQCNCQSDMNTPGRGALGFMLISSFLLMQNNNKLTYCFLQILFCSFFTMQNVWLDFF